MIAFLESCTWQQAVAFFAAANGVSFGVSVAGCRALSMVFRTRQIFEETEPLRRLDVVAAVSAVFLNALISVLGWFLWRNGWIVLDEGGVLDSLWDCFFMLMAMDLGMYIFHRLAHWRPIYDRIHNFHHRHETTNPISLFVLHPFEVVGFGLLMIGFLVIYPMTVLGLVAYLSLNVIFGTVGHSGVEPFPRFFASVPILKYLGTSTFHASHHEQPGYNFGFYTLIWDRLFGTLDPSYDRRFAR